MVTNSNELQDSNEITNSTELLDSNEDLIKDISPSSPPNEIPKALKYGVLTLLIVQNVATIMSMKQASRQPSSDGRQALMTSIVVMVELIKVTICASEIAIRRKGLQGLWAEIADEIVSKKKETALMMVPLLPLKLIKKVCIYIYAKYHISQAQFDMYAAICRCRVCSISSRTTCCL
jgi:hypothetical protein